MCKVCKDGWTMGDRGSCYQETMQNGQPCQLDGCDFCVEYRHRIQEFDKERVCFKCAHGFTRGFREISARYSSQCHPWPVNRCYTQAMHDQNMQGGNMVQAFEMEGQNHTCVDNCTRGLIPNFAEMRCMCPMGSHPIFRPNCDPAQEDCFEHCECNAESQRQGDQCVCNDNSMNMTTQGCKNVQRM